MTVSVDCLQGFFSEDEDSEPNMYGSSSLVFNPKDMSINSSAFQPLDHDRSNSSVFTIREVGRHGQRYTGVKKITCPGARDKLNFRKDKHIFSPNVRWASQKFSAS